MSLEQATTIVHLRTQLVVLKAQLLVSYRERKALRAQLEYARKSPVHPPTRSPMSIAIALENAYIEPREVPGHGVCGLRPLIATWGLFVSLDEAGYSYRYCFETYPQASDALAHWSGEDDPPGPWIKLKGLGVERLGPGATS